MIELTLPDMSCDDIGGQKSKPGAQSRAKDLRERGGRKARELPSAFHGKAGAASGEAGCSCAVSNPYVTPGADARPKQAEGWFDEGELLPASARPSSHLQAPKVGSEKQDGRCDLPLHKRPRIQASVGLQESVCPPLRAPRPILALD